MQQMQTPMLAQPRGKNDHTEDVNQQGSCQIALIRQTPTVPSLVVWQSTDHTRDLAMDYVLEQGNLTLSLATSRVSICPNNYIRIRW